MLDTHKARITQLEAEVTKLQNERSALLQIKNAMSADLENLLDNDREINQARCSS